MTLPDQRFASLVFLIAMLAMLCAAVLLSGCVETDPQTQSTVHQVQQQNQIDLAKQQAKAKLDAAKAKSDPILHPLAANAAAVKTTRDWLLPLGGVLLLAVGGFVGLSFTPLSFVSKIGLPISAGVCAAAWMGIFLLPFFPWVAIGAAVAVIALLVYEIIRHHSITAGLAAALAEVDGKASAAQSMAVGASAVAHAALSATGSIAAPSPPTVTVYAPAVPGSPQAPIVGPTA